jgi:putative transposase
VNPVPIWPSKPNDKSLLARFREQLNFQWPHEALDRRIPAACDAASLRKMSDTRPPLADPDRFEVPYVSANGDIRWHHPSVNALHVCVGAYSGLEDIDDRAWNVHS